MIGTLCAASALLLNVVNAAPLPRVLVLATGGTIAGQGASSTSVINYKPALMGEDIVKSVPELAQYATVIVEQIANIPSNEMTVEIWLKLAKRINRAFAEDATLAGVVITHGTNTIEETAYFLNLTVKHDRPVVLVGSMRPSTAIGADGPANLLSAVRTAVSREARGKGVLVVLNDEIAAARDVTKTNTYRVETFKPGELGFLGYVDGDRVSFYRAPVRRHTAASEFDIAALAALPAVEIAYSYVQASGAAIRAFAAAGVKGIVLAGTGAGLVSAAERDAVKAASAKGRGPLFVRSSRVGNGRVVTREDDAVTGMIAADNLNPQKARILLMLALTKTSDPAEIRRIFDEY